MNPGLPIPVVVTRDGTEQDLNVTPKVSVQTDRFGDEHRMGMIGIASGELDYKKWPPLKAVKQATIETWTMTTSTLKAIGQIIMGLRSSDELGGPLRIAEMSGHVAQEGGWALLWFMSIISINLGLINLFPVPLLDGGHLLYYSIEKIFRRPLNEKVQEIGMRIGLALVVSLMVFSTWNDLVHLEVIAKIKSLFS
jgi:regulator of sigma E protease